jgi:hypothetical protein
LTVQIREEDVGISADGVSTREITVENGAHSPEITFWLSDGLHQIFRENVQWRGYAQCNVSIISAVCHDEGQIECYADRRECAVLNNVDKKAA